MTSHDDIQNGSAKMVRTSPQLLSLLVCPQTRSPLIYDAAAAELISLQAACSLLVCPQTRSPLIYDAAAAELISLQAACAYKITDAVPIMLPSHARPLSEEECVKWQKSQRRNSSEI